MNVDQAFTFTNTLSIFSDECELLQEFNECANGIFKVDKYGWTQNITINSGIYSNSDWCFCHMEPYSNENYFKITFDKFKADFNDELKWFSHYKKMPSKEMRSDSGFLYLKESFSIYSNVMQAQWISNSFQLLFDGVHVKIEAF